MPASKIAALSSPLSIVRSHMHNLSRGEHVVAGFALDHPEDILILSVTDLAARLNVSEATVIRFCQHIGYRGYHEFKICLARDIGREAPKIYSEFALSDDASTVLQKITRLSVQALQDTLSVLKGSELERASRALIKARTVAVCGVGGSGGIALVAQQRLLRLGVPAFACTDTHAMELVCARLSETDVALGVTHSGSTEEIVSALRIAQGGGATTIALTNHARSPVVRCADIVLLTGAAHTPLASEAGVSRIVQLAAIDALCVRVILLNRRLAKKHGGEQDTHKMTAHDNPTPRARHSGRDGDVGGESQRLTRLIGSGPSAGRR